MFLGLLAPVLVVTVRMVSVEMPYLFSTTGFSSTRTAGNETPPVETWPTPLIYDDFCARMVEATLYSSPRDLMSDVGPTVIVGAPAGLTSRYVGSLGRPEGSRLHEALVAVCTSRTASLVSRDRSNYSVIRGESSELDEVILVIPTVRPNGRSGGVVTVAAIILGLAPGSDVLTEMVGKSACGSGDTGSRWSAAIPARTIPMISSATTTGCAMKMADRFIAARQIH